MKDFKKNKAGYYYSDQCNLAEFQEIINQKLTEDMVPNAFEVNAQAEQHQAGRQEVAGRHEVQIGRLAVYQSKAVVHRWQEVADEQRWDDGVKPLKLRKGAAVKDQSQCRHQQAEHHGVVRNQCVHGVQTNEFMRRLGMKKPRRNRGFSSCSEA